MQILASKNLVVTAIVAISRTKDWPKNNMIMRAKKGNKKLMSKEVIAKLDPVGEKVGFYSMGEICQNVHFGRLML